MAMKLLRFNEAANTLKVEPESFEDLYLLARIISVGDKVEARSTRRFKSSESDVGEQKDVTIRLEVEKVEVDKSADRLRLTGRITGGRPEEFIKIKSYHTLNIAPRDVLEIGKPRWNGYLIKRLRQAVLDSKRPRLGVIVLDDEKATISYIRGYGIDIVGEIYSHLSKKMKEKDFEKQRIQYFDEVIKAINGMGVDLVIVAGPGFTREDIRKYIEASGIKMAKRLVYAASSDAERSGIREVMQSETATKLIVGEHVKKEFGYLNIFLAGLRLSGSVHGVDRIKATLEEHKVGVILVNDSVLSVDEVRELLDLADREGVRIEIFNSEDDAGRQLKAFSNIAAIEKSLLKGG